MYYRFCGIILTSFFLLSVYAFGFSGGNGTASNPYQIANMTDIDIFIDSLNNYDYWSYGKYFILTNDIDTIYFPLTAYNST